MNNEVLLAKVSQALGLHEPEYCAENAGILAAWSGGLDSTVLLFLLKTLAARHGFKLFAVHLDHNLRPCSASDAAWCRREAARLGIGIHIEQLHIRPGSSTQNQARAQRYAALFNTANNLGLPFLATAHHADDAIETALINFGRGTSLKGLTSLAAEFSDSYDAKDNRPTQTTRLIRPILNCSRAELEQYAARQQLTWREDPSNKLDHYERNRIRHHIVPELIKNTGTITQLQTSLEHLREDSSALDQIATAVLQQAIRPRPEQRTVVIDRKTIAPVPPAIITRVLTQSHTGWNRATLTTALSLLKHPDHAKNGDRISLTGATATFRRDSIIIEPTIGRGPRELDQRIAHPAHIDITNSGEIRWFDHIISWQRLAYEQEPLPLNSSHTAYFDADLLPETLSLRGPRGNERIVVKPPAGKKRMKDLWNEHAIPADIRWRWPCLTMQDTTQQEQILWICTLRRSHHHQITAQTSLLLMVSCAPASTAVKSSSTIL